jgi:hypothetical protein
MGLREAAALQTLSDTMASFVVVVISLAGILLILLPFAMVFSIVLHGLASGDLRRPFD